MDAETQHPNFYAPTRAEWRQWLEERGQTEKSVWLIVYQKKSATPSVRFHDAIEEAVCFGWVDSKAVKRDAESCYLRFTPRDPKSTWGKVSSGSVNPATPSDPILRKPRRPLRRGFSRSSNIGGLSQARQGPSGNRTTYYRPPIGRASRKRWPLRLARRIPPSPRRDRTEASGRRRVRGGEKGRG